jgi:phosphomannomutase
LTNPIQFGTDGWRGIIGDDFTFANVRRVARAVAAYILKEGGRRQTLVVAYDTRFLSAESARAVAEVAAQAGLSVTLAARPTPTPALSYAVVARQAAGGVMVTASHNPYRWNGVKFKAAYGGSAAPAIIARIQRLISADRPQRAPGARTLQRIETADLAAPYLDHLKTLVDLDRIRTSGRRFVIDPMYGAGRRCVARLLDEARVRCREIHGELNPLFPGLNPEPIEPHVSELGQAVVDGGFDAGFATDGDADRLGAIDRDGSFIDSHKIFSILLKHLVEDRGLRGEVVKTFSTTQMVDGLARKHGLPLHTTPIGFKYVCELMRQRDVLIGGEESGGIGIKGNLPERDGILNSLLLAEVMADRNRTLGELVQELTEEFGPHFYERLDLELDSRQAVQHLLEHIRHHRFGRVAGRPITAKENLDGCKMFFGESTWLLVRPSGTENLLRLYAEAPSHAEVKALLDAMAELARHTR